MIQTKSYFRKNEQSCSLLALGRQQIACWVQIVHSLNSSPSLLFKAFTEHRVCPIKHLRQLELFPASDSCLPLHSTFSITYSFLQANSWKMTDLAPSLVREVYWKIVWLCVTSSQGTSLTSPLNPNFWQEHPSSMNVYQNFRVTRL